jgi:hypothetical protein
LSKQIGVKENTLAKCLTHLRELGLIKDVYFDGRVRVIRACISEYVAKCQSNPALDLNPTLPWIKIQPCVGPESNPLNIIDSKEDIKNKNTREPPPPPRGNSASAEYVDFSSEPLIKTEEMSLDDKISHSEVPPIVYKPPCNVHIATAQKKVSKAKSDGFVKFFGQFVKFKENEYEKLCEIHGKKLVDEIIPAINDYCVNNRPKGYADYSAAFRTFLKRHISVPNKNNNTQVDNSEMVMDNHAYTQRFIKQFYNKIKLTVFDRANFVKIGNDDLYYDNPKFKELFKHFIKKNNLLV